MDGLMLQVYLFIRLFLYEYKTLQLSAAALEHNVLSKNPLTAPCSEVIVQVRAMLRHIVAQMFHLCVQTVVAKCS